MHVADIDVEVSGHYLVLYIEVSHFFLSRSLFLYESKNCEQKQSQKFQVRAIFTIIIFVRGGVVVEVTSGG